MDSKEYTNSEAGSQPSQPSQCSLYTRMDALYVTSFVECCIKPDFKKPKPQGKKRSSYYSDESTKSNTSKISTRKQTMSQDSNTDQKLKFRKERYIPPKTSLPIKADKQKTANEEVCRVFGKYVVDFQFMVEALAEVASCKLCNSKLELFEMRSIVTCASKLIFRCTECFHSKCFWNVGTCADKESCSGNKFLRLQIIIKVKKNNLLQPLW